MKRLFGAAIRGAVMVCVVGSPAAAQNREHQQMAAELRMLQEQQQQLALALAHVTEALEAVGSRLDARLRAGLDEASALTRKGFADQGQELKSLGNDVGAIRERSQETDTRIRSLSDEVEALRLTVASLPSLISQAAQAAVGGQQPLGPPVVDPSLPPVSTNPPAPTPAVPPPAPTVPVPVVPTVPPPTPPSTAGLSPSRLYETAYGDYASGQWTLAIGGFEQLVRTFPQAERADDAQFFIGESLVALNRFADAIAAYNLVIQNYPRGDQANLAYYKRGLTHERLKQLDAARASFELAIKLYPDSAGAVMAKPGLDRVDRALAAQQPAPPAR